MKRKNVLVTLIAVFALASLLGRGNGIVAEENDALSVVQDGEAQSVVVIPEDTNDEDQESADILVEYVERSTGAKLPIMTEAELEEGDSDAVRIYIGANFSDEEHIDNGLEALDGDGFLIHPHDNHLTIVGPTELGTRNGVYEFLERYVGVRWLMPGDTWTDVPEQSNIIVIQEDVRQEPDFQFRSMNLGADGDDHKQVRNEWKVRNRVQSPQQLALGHNLFNIVPVEKYGESNPEFYPGGKPPAKGENTGWQPCFSEEGTIDVAVNEILDYFERNPEATSISLAVNDSGGYCEGDPSHPNYPDKINSVGRQDLSDIYYAWVNEVVEQVLEVYPDKWFGLYAYQEAMDPPSFDVHPRAVPVVTKDRLSWIDDEVREYSHQHLEEWAEVSSQSGWYAYLYGYQYAVPRVYSHLIAENYKYAKEKNVLTHHADFHPSLGDGPKMWLSAKLQWDTNQDVDDLLDEWYERAVGSEAATDLKAYYDLWEAFWMERAEDSSWFQNSKHDTYLSLNDFSYLGEVTEEDISESRSLLESVVAKAETEEQETRAELMLRNFEYYEASALSYPRNIDTPKNEEEALDILENWANTLEFRLDMIQKRHDLVEAFKEEDLSIRFPGTPFRRGEWTGWNPDEFWHLVDYIETHEPNGGAVTDQVNVLTQQYEDPKVREFAQLLRDMESPTSLTENPSFEEGEEDATNWNFWDPKRTANIQRVEDFAHTGNSSVLFENADQAGIYQILPIEPGILASQVHFYTPEGNESEGTIQIVIEAFNDSGDKIVYRSDAAKLADTAGEWASVGFLEDIPDKIEGKETTEILLNVQINNAEDTQVYQDDIVVYQHTPSISDIKSLVEGFANDGEFATESAARAVTLHLTALERFEDQGATAKVLKHMNGLNQLLDHQAENELISDKAYQVLQSEAEAFVKQYMTAHLNTGHIQASTFGDHSLSVSLSNHTAESLDITFESEFPEGISLEIDEPIQIDAEQAIEVEGNVQLSNNLAEGDHEGNIHVKVNGNKVHTLPLTVTLNRSLIQNSSFEIGSSTAAPWKNWIPESGSMKRVEGIAHTGDASYQVNIEDRGGPYQIFDIEPGNLFSKVHYYTPEGTETNGVARIFINVRNADGNNLYSTTSDEINLSELAGEWASIEILEEIPETVNGQEVKEIQIGMSFHDVEPDTPFYIDDFVAYQDGYQELMRNK